MKIVGTIMVHSILQGGPGFPLLSPAVYNYLCKGNIEDTVKTVTAEDCSVQIQHVIKEVRQS